MGKRSAGTASFLYDGIVINLVGELNSSLAVESSELVKGMDSHVAEEATPQVPFAEGVFRDQSDISLKVLQKLDGVDVQIQYRNGKTEMYPDCKQVGRVEKNGVNGTFPLRFESRGEPSEDLTA